MPPASLRLFLQILTLIATTAAAALAQVTVDTSEIAGIVLDATGGRVAGATVTLVDPARGGSRTAETSAAGEYRFTLLPPSRYRLTIEKAGFERLVLDDVQALVGTAAKLEQTLKLAAVSERVEVAAPGLDPNRIQLASVVVARQLELLPINGRNYLDLALLTPGVSQSTALVDQADFRTPTAPASGLSFAGGNGRGNAITLDGLSHNGSTGNFRPTVPQEAVQEFQVNRSGYGAELGGSIGGAINIVTRSGTNTTQGSGFLLFRDRTLQSRNFFDPGDADYRRWQVGGSVGGPIRRDRTFYFGAVERLDRDESAFVTILDDPGVLDRLTPGQADLVSALGASGVPALAGLGAALQGALTPSANPAVAPLFAANSGVFPFTGVNTQGMVRVDHRLTDLQLLTMRANVTRERLANTRLGALAGFNHGSTSEWRDVTVSVGDSMVLNDRWLAVARGAFSLSRFTIVPTDPIGPELLVSGYGTFGRDYLYPLRQREKYFDGQLTVSHLRRRHMLKFGAEVNPVSTRVDIETFFGGRFIFGEFIPLAALLDAFTSTPGFAAGLRAQLAGSGQASAAAAIDAPITALQSFALGLPVAYIQAFGSTFSASTRHQHSLFVEDVFQAGDTLTVTAGARLQFNAMTNLESRTYLDPRVGMTWSPSPRTIVRAAAGRYHAWVDGTIGYSAEQLRRTDVTNVFIPLSGAFGVINPATGAPVTSADVYQSLAARGILGQRAVTLADLTPLGIQPGLPFPVTGGVDPDYDAPAATHVNAEIEREFPLLTTRASYSYNRTRHLWRTIDRNLAQAGTRPDGWPIFGVVNPSLLNNYVIESTGRANHHALTLEASRRFGRQWSMDAHYTYSHAMDDVTDFNIDYAPHNQLDPRADYGPSLFNARHGFVLSAAFAQASAGAGASLRAGWSAAAIVRASSGRPFNVLTGFDNLGDGQVNTHRPLGLSRNAGTGPAFFSVDTRAGWTTGLGPGRPRLQLTVEAFNLFNRVNFSTVNNIVGNTPLSALPDPLTARQGSAATPLAFTAAHAPRQFQIGARILF